MQIYTKSDKCNIRKYSHIQSKLVLQSGECSEPRVSIMIPTFRRPQFLREAVASAVSQCIDFEYEVVIVDNDGTGEFKDDIISIISKYAFANIRYFINEQNVGMYGNWNRCIELARAEYLTILNDDDILSTRWLSCVYPDRKVKGFVSTGYRRFKCSINLPNDNSFKKSVVTFADMLVDMHTNGTLGCLFNRNTLLDLNGFDDSEFPISDYLLFLNLLRTNTATHIHGAFAFCRVEVNESYALNTIINTIEKGYNSRLLEITNFVGNKRLAAVYSKAFKYKRVFASKKLNKDFSVIRFFEHNYILVVVAFFIRLVPTSTLRRLLILSGTNE